MHSCQCRAAGSKVARARIEVVPQITPSRAVRVHRGRTLTPLELVAGPLMPHYRAYILDEQGHLKGVVNFDCADDEEAKQSFKHLGGNRGNQIELWRQVALLQFDGPYEP
jgi:hypothetical protein